MNFTTDNLGVKVPASHLTVGKLVVLGIESSCDETAASVIGGGRIRSSVIASQLDIHRAFGGVVPELASREHERVIIPTIRVALDQAGISDPTHQLDAVAVTRGPGLSGALMVGVAAAKALSIAYRIPVIGVDHMEGHIFASALEMEPPELPAMVLLVSGGHTQLIDVQGPGRYRLVGQSVDDAAGEAFDKVARLLGLGFPGGPVIDRVAALGDPDKIRFPRASTKGEFDFSFSGVKTAVLRYLESNADAVVEDVAAGFQAAVVDVLVRKTTVAAQRFDSRSVVLGGGVAANSLLRKEMEVACGRLGLSINIPAPASCTDNGAMVAAAAVFRLETDGPSDPGFSVDPSLLLPYLT